VPIHCSTCRTMQHQQRKRVVCGDAAMNDDRELETNPISAIFGISATHLAINEPASPASQSMPLRAARDAPAGSHGSQEMDEVLLLGAVREADVSQSPLLAATSREPTVAPAEPSFSPQASAHDLRENGPSYATKWDPIWGPPVRFDPRFPQGRSSKKLSVEWDPFFGPPVVKGQGGARWKQNDGGVVSDDSRPLLQLPAVRR
jgi:hypothetical protein